jgi:hypothetical protein
VNRRELLKSVIGVAVLFGMPFIWREKSIIALLQEKIAETEALMRRQFPEHLYNDSSDVQFEWQSRAMSVTLTARDNANG